MDKSTTDFLQHVAVCVVNLLDITEWFTQQQAEESRKRGRPSCRKDFVLLFPSLSSFIYLFIYWENATYRFELSQMLLWLMLAKQTTEDLSVLGSIIGVKLPHVHGPLAIFPHVCRKQELSNIIPASVPDLRVISSPTKQRYYQALFFCITTLFMKAFEDESLLLPNRHIICWCVISRDTAVHSMARHWRRVKGDRGRLAQAVGSSS